MRRIFIQILILLIGLSTQLAVKAGTAYLPPIIDDPVKLNKEVERRVVHIIKLGDIAEQCITFSALGPSVLGIPVPSNFVNPNAPSCETYVEERTSILGEFHALRKNQLEPYFRKNKNLKNKTEVALALINELDARLKVAASSEASRPRIDDTKKINGAFGLVLGRVFSPQTDAVSTSSVSKVLRHDPFPGDPDPPMYEVKPAKPYRSFTKYYVQMTPESRKIHSVWGIGSIEGYSACQEEVAVLIDSIQSKYSDLSKEPDPPWRTIFSQGDRRIIVEEHCDAETASTIRITYEDLTLGQLATEEQDKIEKDKLRQKSRTIDSSGL